MVGLGNGVVGDSGLRGLPHSHMRFAPMEMMENRLLGLLAGLRILGFLPTDLAAHAVEGLLQGSQVVWLGKRRLCAGSGVRAGLRIRWLLLLRGGTGYGLPIRDSLRVRNRGIR